METKTPKTIVTAEGKRVKRPVKTSERKRPCKTYIERMCEIRGFMTGNERTQLATLEIRNALQRINNKAMSENVNETFTGDENAQIQALIKAFVKDVNEVLKTV
jgi:hypothetical protein